MPTDFWSGWIAAVTIVTLIALAGLVVSVYFSKDPVDVAGEVWDENLREGAVPAPLWWFWLIVALLAVSVVYLMLYPGLGSFRGALGWSQGGEIAEALARYDERFGAERERLAQAPLDALRADPAAMRSAANLFDVHCAACHGADGRGQAQLFPDLTDDDWQWGGTEADVLRTLEAGRVATMPGWESVLGEEAVAAVTDYVLSLGARHSERGGGPGDVAAGGAARDAASGGQAGENVSSGQPAGNVAAEDPGAIAFRTYCSACHGPDGSGLPVLGAPALNDDVWLYGGSPAAVRESIALGRNGQMPAFGERLDETQRRLLAAWLTRGGDSD